MKFTFFDCKNLVVNNCTFTTISQTPPASANGDSFHEDIGESAQQQASKARQQAREARQEALMMRQEARRARQEARRVRQEARKAQQGFWTAWWRGDNDYYSTDSEEDDDLELGPKQHISFNGVRVEQKVGCMGRGCDIEILSRAEEKGHMRGQNAKVEQMGVTMERAADRLERRASEMSATLERAANERAEHTREHVSNIFITGRNHTRRRPHDGISVSFINNGRITSGSNPSPSQKAKPKSQSTPKPLYTERHEAAASLIQRKFRVHRSLRTIDIISLEFQMVKDTFIYPRVIDLQIPGSEEGHISLRVNRVPSEFDEGGASVGVDEPQPKLAHTPANHPVQSQMKELEKLLVRLDGTESWGNKGVREKRRLVAREIGKESAKLERYWKQAWIDYVEKKQRGGMRDEEARAEVFLENVVHVEPSKVEDDDEWFDVDAA